MLLNPRNCRIMARLLIDYVNIIAIMWRIRWRRRGGNPQKSYIYFPTLFSNYAE